MVERVKTWVDQEGVKLLTKLIVIAAIPWSVWVTRGVMDHQAFRNQGDRFSKLDGAILEIKFDRRIDALPPKDWRDRIDRIEANLENLERAQRQWIDEMSRDFLRKNER